jgi:hypothetical protein
MQHLRKHKPAAGLDINEDPRPAAAWCLSMPIVQCGISEAMEPQEETVGGWRVMRAGGGTAMTTLAAADAFSYASEPAKAGAAAFHFPNVRDHRCSPEASATNT